MADPLKAEREVLTEKSSQRSEKSEAGLPPVTGKWFLFLYFGEGGLIR